ncbi:DinB family protein [Kribbella pittospori]|uniref:DinB family protein n=1 Tax=Kribbella pittospori TaxID=722689 RepID=A0A4R0KTC1_9ACTN|nr:DinB family protein [Kribbella pittospori]
MRAYVETGVQMAMDDGTAAWVFDASRWGCCGQGVDEAAALRDLGAELGSDLEFVVVERVVGDEQAFERDLAPAREAERAATLEILEESRRETVALIASCSPEMLDFDDPDRVLPSFAGWRTVRQLAWHIADTESRYYLPSLGLPYREPLPDLADELKQSAEYVRRAVATIPADLVRRANGEVWTTVKVLRRLAWHERSELRTLRRLVALALRSM